MPSLHNAGLLIS